MAGPEARLRELLPHLFILGDYRRSSAKASRSGDRVFSVVTWKVLTPSVMLSA
jgi:hypothetical protein